MAPRYDPEPGPRGLARRLSSLVTAGVPVRCGVVLGLHRPGADSSRVAEVTHALARHLVEGTAPPRFNTVPSPMTRVYAAASRGRVDALGPDMAAFPADLATPLWWRVLDKTGGPLTTAERSAAADLLLRLGYQRRAASVVGDRPELVVKRLAVRYWSSPSSTEVEAEALREAHDRRNPTDVRHTLAVFVVVRNGRRGTATPAFHEAAAVAARTVPRDPLRLQAHYRALAFVPYLCGDLPGTWALLERAVECQRSVVPSTELERLAWEDHAFPLHETIARTHLLTGAPDRAAAETDHLVTLSPHDHRTWSLRGDAFLAADRLEEAIGAYDRGVRLGGLPAARAAFYRGWAQQRLGLGAEAVESFRLSHRIDPTAPVVARALSGVGAGGVA
ncbi:MAG: tetratricopeptide repeat protein [Saccharothrix sp.]|nr:tetratricopeptide repeat protein [Saccharothrix sp.]